MITFSSDFVKTALPRAIMLQSKPIADRLALPADLHLTRCPNAKLLRLPSADAGHPTAAGYAERRALVGCRASDCEVCQQDAVIKRIITWSQRLKALLSYEVEVRGSDLQFISLTFPPHPDGNPERDGAPSEDMVQAAWRHFRVVLSDWYKRHGVAMREACNMVGFVEEGMRNGRLHFHIIFAARPDFPHPHTEEERELLSTLDRYGNRQFLDGLGRLWRKVLTNRGYEELQNWYRAPPKSAAEIAGYVTSAYLTKGFFSNKTYRVRAGRQSPPWPEIIDWWRDKRFHLQGKSYRRWVGFKVHVSELNEDNIREECKRLGRHYASEYTRGVSVGGQRVRVDADMVTMHLLQGLSRYMSKVSEKKRLMGESAGIPVCIQFRPVLIALADREVRHPARADYLSVANYYETSDTFGSPEVVANPGDLVEEDARYNLCGASHWFPMDGNELHVRGTEAFDEIVGWNVSVTSKFDSAVIEVLNKSLPGTAWSFIMQGLKSPVNVIDEERVNRVASGFPEVFPDSILTGLTEPSYERSLPVKATVAGDVHSDIAAALERCASWPELTDIRASEAAAPGNWPFFFLKRGQVSIVNRIHEQGRSGIYNLPTSFGKSLCYQIPNVADGVTLVVSPLLSLIRDQVQALKKRGINATWVGGEHDKAQKTARLEQVGAINRTVDDRDNLHCIVYCAPESFDVHAPSERFLARFLSEGYLNVSHLVVDEAHCVTEWSDFRPAFRGIPAAVSRWRYPPRVLSLFSATVSPRILRDLRGVFGYDLDFFALPMVRDNLFLRRRPAGFYDFFAFEWHRVVKSPALVYCGQRARTEEVASFLRKQGVNAVHYHAGLDSEKRVRIEDGFRDGDIDVLCATIAFGMGVDIRNIRTVIHDSFPQTLEDYAQQIGRGGRDGLASECILLHNPGMVDSPDMHSYFHSDGCLWSHIALHHGQPASPCGHCDGCAGTETFLPL